MDKSLLEISRRLTGLRDSLDLSVEEMAASIGIDPEIYRGYENGSRDIPVSLLHKLSGRYEIPMATLLLGEEPKMQTYFVTRAGHGANTGRDEVYNYQDLAAGFVGRTLAPFMVTVTPGMEAPDCLLRNTHPGHEFIYIISGVLEVTVGRNIVVLDEGDTILFDSNQPHCVRAIGSRTARFIDVLT